MGIVVAVAVGFVVTRWDGIFSVAASCSKRSRHNGREGGGDAQATVYGVRRSL
jgi:predicted SpoU family rRNA methylase